MPVCCAKAELCHALLILFKINSGMVSSVQNSNEVIGMCGIFAHANIILVKNY